MSLDLYSLFYVKEESFMDYQYWLGCKGRAGYPGDLLSHPTLGTTNDWGHNTTSLISTDFGFGVVGVSVKNNYYYLTKPIPEKPLAREWGGFGVVYWWKLLDLQSTHIHTTNALSPKG
jgi:hypothetical protein